jgi:hypothetical protein
MSTLQKRLNKKKILGLVNERIKASKLVIKTFA